MLAQRKLLQKALRAEERKQAALDAKNTELTDARAELASRDQALKDSDCPVPENESTFIFV